MPTLGPWELAIILVIVVVIFGAGRVSEIGGALGRSIREFKTAATTDDAEKDERASAEKPLAEKPLAEKPLAEKPLVKDETIR